MSETRVVDYSFARPAPSAIKAAGYVGAVRYLGGSQNKQIDSIEAGLLHKAGLAIALVFESSATRATSGNAAGAADAQSARSAATRLGYPVACPIFFAVDSDLPEAAVAPYFQGVSSVLGPRAGVYGGIKVMGVSVPWKWQTAAWSGGHLTGEAHLYQRAVANGALPSGCDQNVVCRPIPFWGPSGVVTLTPPGVPQPEPPKVPPVKPERSPKQVPGVWAKFAHFEPYYRNDSIDGLDWAVKHGYNAIDLNFQVTKDLVIVNTHWSQPILKGGFHDPLGKIAKNAQIKDLTWREVARLRAPGGHRIHTMARMLAEAKKRNLRVEFEAKNSPAFTHATIWARVNRRATQLGLSLQMKVESWVDVPGGAPAILRAAMEGGIGARILLPRGSHVLKKDAYWPVANYVRGPVIWR